MLRIVLRVAYERGWMCISYFFILQIIKIKLVALICKSNIIYIEKALTVLSSTPPRKAKASKEGKRKKGSDLKRSSMKKNAGGARPHGPCPIIFRKYLQLHHDMQVHTLMIISVHTCLARQEPNKH